MDVIRLWRKARLTAKPCTIGLLQNILIGERLGLLLNLAQWDYYETLAYGERLGLPLNLAQWDYYETFSLEKG